jgi:Icc-related predicted phosphoesterase
MYLSEAAPPQKGMVKVKLTKADALIVSGDITGRMYVFRNINDVNWVDKRDAVSMKERDELQVLH